MRVIFMGTPGFALKSLTILYENGFGIAAVVTVPDKPQGRGLKIKSSPVKQFALQKKLTILQPEKLKDPLFRKRLLEFKADVFVIVAFKILPPEIFTIPPSGTINVHASLLPKYRGAAPINWAIINGESETGVTTMRIDANVDTGDILLQKVVTITKNMTAGELHDILAEEGAKLLVKTLKGLEDIQPQKQDILKISKAPKINAETGKIDFSSNSINVHNFIRGLSPYPGAYTFFKSKKIKILESALAESPVSVNPGMITEVKKDYFEVSCGSGSVKILQVQPEGKRRMSAAEFINGFHLKKEDKLESV